MKLGRLALSGLLITSLTGCAYFEAQRRAREEEEARILAAQKAQQEKLDRQRHESDARDFRRFADQNEERFERERQRLKLREAEVEGWMQRHGSNPKLQGAPELNVTLELRQKVAERIKDLDAQHEKVRAWVASVEAPTRQDCGRVNEEYATVHKASSDASQDLSDLVTQQHHLESLERR